MINGNSILNRRNFIKLASLGIFSVTFQPWSLVCDSVKKRLNVLIIICDDLNDALEGMGGHPQAKTPNIDRFIKQGLQFTNCHSNNPLCGPSRASLWTGYYPHTTGYYGWDQNNNKWRNNRIMKNCVTIFEHFANHGYGLYGTGKIFHNNQDTLPLFQDHDGSSGFGYGMSYGPYPWDGKSEWPWSVRHPSMRQPWGVSVFETFVPLSDIPHVKPDLEKGIPGAKGWFDIFEKAKYKPFRYVNELDRDLMTDELSAQWIIDRLNDKHDEPFFMTVGFIRPHSPWIVPEKYFNMFPIEEIEFPPYLKNDLDDIADVFKKTMYEKWKNSHGDKFKRLLHAYGGDIGWKKWIQGYLASVAFVDDQFGKIMNALENSPYSDNTIVILTSDHGYHMGEKDWLFKLTVWEESTRVPFVMLVPGVTKNGTKCDYPISLVDLYPTLIDMCGLPTNPNENGNRIALDGHSLKPFLISPSDGQWDGPSVALSCIYGQYPVERDEPGKKEDQHFTVRSRHWRYILCNNGEEELYNHQNDPHEWHNLADDRKYADIKKNLKHTLLQLTGL